jgi:hypothetical protein
MLTKNLAEPDVSMEASLAAHLIVQGRNHLMDLKTIVHDLFIKQTTIVKVTSVVSKGKRSLH